MVLAFHFVVVVVVGKEKLLNLDICLYILLDIKISYFNLSFSHNTFYAIDCYHNPQVVYMSLNVTFDIYYCFN